MKGMDSFMQMEITVAKVINIPKVIDLILNCFLVFKNIYVYFNKENCMVLIIWEFYKSFDLNTKYYSK